MIRDAAVATFPDNFAATFARGDNKLSPAFAKVAVMKLIDERTSDGSRNFARLPKIVPWEGVRDHVLLLGDAKVVNYVGDELARAWLDFSFRGHRFLIHSHENQIHLFVRDPQCSDLLLYQVGCHFERLLGGMSGEG